MRVREIKIEAKERFAVNRYQAMLIYGVVYALALNIAVITTLLWTVNKWAVWYGVILIFLFLLMLAPFAYGMTGFYLKLYKFESSSPSLVFEGFNKHNLERVVVLRLLKFAMWLAFTLLLIVPGIVFLVRSSMATYILRANPKLRPIDAIRASNRIMKSHCLRYFALVFSFAGWFFMGIVTFGLGFIWVLPYENVAKIVFYKRELQGDKTVYRNPRDQKAVKVGGNDTAQPDLTPEEKERRFFADERIEVDALGTETPLTKEEKRQFGITDCKTQTEITPDEREREDRFFYGSEKIEVEEYEESPELIPPYSEEPAEQDLKVFTEAEATAETPEEIHDNPLHSTDGTHESESSPPRSREVRSSSGRSAVTADDGKRVIEAPITGKALPDSGSDTVEINEQGESVQQRLVRLRAERAAKMGQKGNTPTKKNNVEIGED